MSRRLAVLRPAPGNAATAALIRARGLEPVLRPLFAVRALAWTPPPPARFDALLVTSANALRHGGESIDLYRDLPLYAVGDATAAAARAGGWGEVRVGAGDAAALIAHARRDGITRALHLGARGGRLGAGGIVAEAHDVYVSDALAAGVEDLADCVALIHSPRAGARLAALTGDDRRLRGSIAVAAISAAALAAAGSGWRMTAGAERPTDAATVAAAASLAD